MSTYSSAAAGCWLLQDSETANQVQGCDDDADDVGGDDDADDVEDSADDVGDDADGADAEDGDEL